jgi:hypothetical protein
MKVLFHKEMVTCSEQCRLLIFCFVGTYFWMYLFITKKIRTFTKEITSYCHDLTTAVTWSNCRIWLDLRHSFLCFPCMRRSYSDVARVMGRSCVAEGSSFLVYSLSTVCKAKIPTVLLRVCKRQHCWQLQVTFNVDWRSVLVDSCNWTKTPFCLCSWMMCLWSCKQLLLFGYRFATLAAINCECIVVLRFVIIPIKSSAKNLKMFRYRLSKVKLAFLWSVVGALAYWTLIFNGTEGKSVCVTVDVLFLLKSECGVW